MSAPPFPIEGEKRQLNGGLYVYSHDIEPREGDSYMPSKVTLWNSSEDTQYRVTFTLSEANVTTLSDTKNEQEGVYQSLLYPGEAKELFEGSYASYKLSMQFGTPDKAWLDKQAAEEMKDVQVEIDAVKALVRLFPSPDGKYTADYIATLCEAYQIPFVDLTFPPKPTPTLARDFENSELSKAVYPFKRPHSYIDDVKKTPPGLWLGSSSTEAIQPTDVCQGSLGNCYYTSAIAGLAENPRRIERMFKAPRCPDLGIYRIIMTKNGWKHVVTMSDLLPTRNGKPVFMSNKNEAAEIYPSILELAYAKLHGSYASIAGGSPPHAVADCIGTPFVRFRDHPGWEEPGKASLFDFVEDADRRGAVISLATPGVDTSDYAGGGNSANEEAISEKYKAVGLVSGHAFSILRAARYRNHKLVQIRNPWGGDREWSGKWGDDDTDSWTPDAKAALGYKKQDDGSFWMEWSDVWNWFDGGAANFTVDGWSCARIAGNFDNGVSDVVVRITNSGNKPIKLFMGMHQKDNRGLKPADVKKYVAVLTAITRQKPNSQRVEVLSQSGEAFMSARDVFMETELPPCDASNPYYAVPMCYSEVDRSFVASMWFSSHEDLTVEFMGFKDNFKEKRLMHPANFIPSQCSMKVAANIQVETPQLDGLWVNQETHIVDWDLELAQPPTREELENYANVDNAHAARERAIKCAAGEPINKVKPLKPRLAFGTPAPKNNFNNKKQNVLNQVRPSNIDNVDHLGETIASADFRPTPSMLPSASMIVGDETDHFGNGGGNGNGGNGDFGPSASEVYRESLLGGGGGGMGGPSNSGLGGGRRPSGAGGAGPQPNRVQASVSPQKHIDPFAGGGGRNNTDFGGRVPSNSGGLLQVPTLGTTGPAPVQDRPTPALVANKPMSLVVTAVSGSGLAARDISGKSDPYLTVAVLDANKIPRKDIPAQSTPYDDQTLDPVWGHTMKPFPNINAHDIFEISCWDKDFIGRDEFMGSCQVYARDLGLLNGERKSKKVELQLKGETPAPLPFLPAIPTSIPTYGEIQGTISLVFKVQS